MYFWDLQAQTRLKEIEGHQGKITDIVLEQGEQNTIVTASADSTVKIWDVRSSFKHPIYSFEQHQGTVNSVAISPDGNWIASGGDDGSLKIWEIGSGKIVNELP